MSRLTVKSSTILISVGAKTRIYHSVDEVPVLLRRKLAETTSGVNSATILIADRAGRDEIAKAIDGLPSRVQSRVALKAARRAARVHMRLSWQHWAEILLPGVIGLTAWLLFSLK